MKKSFLQNIKEDEGRIVVKMSIKWRAFHYIFQLISHLITYISYFSYSQCNYKRLSSYKIKQIKRNNICYTSYTKIVQQLYMAQNKLVENQLIVC